MKIVGIIVIIIAYLAIACMVGRILKGIARHYTPGDAISDSIRRDYHATKLFRTWRGVS